MIQVVNPIEYENWNDMILNMPNYSFFHTSEWAQVLWKSYGYKPYYFVDVEDGKVDSILPVMSINSCITGKRGVSLPFSDHCEPLVYNGNHFKVVIDNALNFGRKIGWKYIELRGGGEYLQTECTSESFRGHIIDIQSGIEKLFGSLRDSTRRNIRKAEKEDVSIRIASSPDSVKDFTLLNFITRKKHGLPPQPESFFKAFYKYVIATGHGFISLASFKGKTIAASVFLLAGKKALFKYGASDEEYNHLRANNLVMWHAIQRCHALGCESIDLGRSELQNRGLNQFKAGWNPKEFTIHYYNYSFLRNKFVRSERVNVRSWNNIFRKLPIPICKAIGSLSYRHFG
jgi:hypothetical protein